MELTYFILPTFRLLNFRINLRIKASTVLGEHAFSLPSVYITIRDAARSFSLNVQYSELQTQQSYSRLFKVAMLHASQGTFRAFILSLVKWEDRYELILDILYRTLSCSCHPKESVTDGDQQLSSICFAVKILS